MLGGRRRRRRRQGGGTAQIVAAVAGGVLHGRMAVLAGVGAQRIEGALHQVGVGIVAAVQDQVVTVGNNRTICTILFYNI